MLKVFTLRNIITLFTIFILAACNKNESELQSISSEDNSYHQIKDVKEIVDAKTGRVVYVITKK